MPDGVRNSDDVDELAEGVAIDVGRVKDGVDLGTPARFNHLKTNCENMYFGY